MIPLGKQISFGAILTPLGVGLLAYGFGAFFQLLPGTEVSAIMLIYGFPISLLGFALSYAQLKPVPCKTTRKALDLRESQATDIQKQVWSLCVCPPAFYLCQLQATDMQSRLSSCRSVNQRKSVPIRHR
jgi:hypothetical protein